jgi:hypothetical protein
MKEQNFILRVKSKIQDFQPRRIGHNFIIMKLQEKEHAKAVNSNLILSQTLSNMMIGD